MSEELEKKEAEKATARKTVAGKSTVAKTLKTDSEEERGSKTKRRTTAIRKPKAPKLPENTESDKKPSVKASAAGGRKTTVRKSRAVSTKNVPEADAEASELSIREEENTAEATRAASGNEADTARDSADTQVDTVSPSSEEERADKKQGQGEVQTADAGRKGGSNEAAAAERVISSEHSSTPHDPDARSVHGILEVMQDGFGFIRSENFLPGEQDVYVNPQMIRRYGLKTGDMIQGFSKSRNPQERYGALMYIETLNGLPLFKASHRVSFEKLTPVFPRERLHLEIEGEKSPTAIRVLDLLSPIGKGQRGMIVSPPKAGKTTLLKQIAKAIVKNEPAMHLLILLIDERPEEVTDMKEEVEGGLVQVIYSTFDETPENHRRVSEMTIERAKRLVEQGEDVTILLDSITRLARAYNLTVAASGRTLSGGLDPAALHPPKKFFGAARNMREHGSLTILATALVDTGSRMDDVIYEEFKGTGNMELVLNRELQERRIFPAIDILKSGTRRDDLLLSPLERDALDLIHRELSDDKKNSAEELLSLFERTENNTELCEFLVNRKPIVSESASMRQKSNLLVKVNKRGQ